MCPGLPSTPVTLAHSLLLRTLSFNGFTGTLPDFSALTQLVTLCAPDFLHPLSSLLYTRCS